jgi:hypothetical protein
MSKSWLLAILGAAALGTVAYGYSAQAAIPKRCEALPNPQSRAECACEWALKKNTVVAIEEFMSKYGSEDTACNALALVPANRWHDPGRERTPTPTVGEPGSPS